MCQLEISMDWFRYYQAIRFPRFFDGIPSQVRILLMQFSRFPNLLWKNLILLLLYVHHLPFASKKISFIHHVLCKPALPSGQKFMKIFASEASINYNVTLHQNPSCQATHSNIVLDTVRASFFKLPSFEFFFHEPENPIFNFKNVFTSMKKEKIDWLIVHVFG